MKSKVLIIDDDGDTLESFADLLEGEGDFQVFKAGPNRPVQNALRLWKEYEDLYCAVVDLKMPDESGYSPSENVGFKLIRDLKASRPDARIAVRSAFQRGTLPTAVRAGADSFMLKAWDIRQTLGNMCLLQDWIRARRYQGIWTRAEMTVSPIIFQRRRRVAEYCRGIVAHLPDANPVCFDLACCLAAAENCRVHDGAIQDELLIGPISDTAVNARESLEQRLRWANDLSAVGEGFQRVAEIVYQHLRAYADPRNASIPDFPQGDNLPPRSRIPLESRVMHLGSILEQLLSQRSDRSARDLVQTCKIVESLGDDQVLDPRVVDAFKRWLREDQEWVISASYRE